MVSISLGLMCDIHSSSCLESDSISAIFSRAESITSSASGAVSSVISDGSIKIKGLTLIYWGAYISWILGVLFLWIAGMLTFITGIDYLRKSLPYLKDGN